jgi:hypothetical protein
MQIICQPRNTARNIIDDTLKVRRSVLASNFEGCKEMRNMMVELCQVNGYCGVRVLPITGAENVVYPCSDVVVVLQ